MIHRRRLICIFAAFAVVITIVCILWEEKSSAGNAAVKNNVSGLTIDIAAEDEAESEASADAEQMAELQEDIVAFLAGKAGNWSVYVQNLDTGSEISINPGSMYAASLIKLYVMESCYENWDMVTANAEDFYGTAEMSGAEQIEELLYDMITCSDNEAFNELVRLHSESGSFTEGCQYIEDCLIEKGYTDTGIFHTLHPSDSESETISEESNRTSAEDCGRLLASIYNKTCVSAEASEEMLAILEEQQNRDKIPAGVPEGIVTANKTGETEEEQHDAAIVYGTQTDYVLCVMSSEFLDITAAYETIQQISTLVFEQLNP